MRNTHEDVDNQSNSSMDTAPEKDNINGSLDCLEKVSWEEKRFDEELMDTHSITNKPKKSKDPVQEDIEMLERSNFRDNQIKEKEKKRNEREEIYRLEKQKEEDAKSTLTKSNKRRKRRNL